MSCPKGVEVVDCVARVAVVVEKAQRHREELIALLSQWPDEAWGWPVAPLCNGPSYIDVGAVLGSQTLAFVLFAVGKVLGLWDIITSQTLGIEGEKAGALAGLGFVMISGFRPESLAAAG